MLVVCHGSTAVPGPCRFGVRVSGVDQGCDGWVGAQRVQAAAAVGSDAADGDAQFGADLGVGHRGVVEEEREQPL